MEIEKLKSLIVKQCKEPIGDIRYALYKQDCRVADNDTYYNRKTYLRLSDDIVVAVELIEMEKGKSAFQVNFKPIDDATYRALVKDTDPLKSNVIDMRSGIINREFYCESVSLVRQNIFFNLNRFKVGIKDGRFYTENMRTLFSVALNLDDGQFWPRDGIVNHANTCQLIANKTSPLTTYVYAQINGDAMKTLKAHLGKFCPSPVRAERCVKAFMAGSGMHPTQTPLQRILLELVKPQ